MGKKAEKIEKGNAEIGKKGVAGWWWRVASKTEL